MNLRFVRITNYYPQVIKWFYKSFPFSSSESYSAQHELLTSNVMDHVSAYIRELNAIGYHATEIISNALPLQRSWRKENKLPDDLSVYETVLNQLKKLQPEVLWMDDLSFADSSSIAEIRSSVPGLKMLITHLCAPYNKTIEAKLQYFDLIVTCTPSFLNPLKALGLNTALIYHGFDHQITKQIKAAGNRNHSLVFSGSLYTGSAFHQGRIRYLEKMIDAGLNIELFANTESRLKFSIRKIYECLKHGVATSGKMKFYSARLARNIKPPVFGRDMYALLGSSKVCFNMHGEVAGNSAGNIRMFEATGMGCCLLTDNKENMAELFDPGKEVMLYENEDDCIEKAKWLLMNDELRLKLASAGQQRTLKDHTLAKRVNQLDMLIRDFIR